LHVSILSELCTSVIDQHSFMTPRDRSDFYGLCPG
jgi:hypothetical protein